MGEVETVGGRIDARELGRTLGHEHLKTTFENVRTQWPHLYDEAAKERAAIVQVERAMSHGVKTIVDPACVDRILRAAAEASKRTGRPIMVHPHPGTRRGLEIMDVMESEGIDPSTGSRRS